MKKTAILVAVLASACGVLWLWNEIAVGRPVREIVTKDSRNAGIDVSLHFDHFVNPSVLVFDLGDVAHERSPLDVFRVFLQSAYALRDSDFKTVKLSFRGNARFMLAGDYFHQLGNEYNQQNPVFTMRTFSEHLMFPNGSAAYGSWTGGLLGVVTRQMQDFSDFQKRWYLADLLGLAGSSAELPEGPISLSSSTDAAAAGESAATYQEAQTITSAPITPISVQAQPSLSEPAPSPPTRTRASEIAKKPWPEQVYVDSPSRYFYPENCPGRPSTAGRMPRSVALREGFTLAPTCQHP